MKLAEARKNINLTQEKLTQKINVTLRHYIDIEKGRHMPAVDLALKLCKILKVDPRDIEEWKT